MSHRTPNRRLRPPGRIGAASLRGRGHRPPPAGALWDVRVVGLRAIAVIPVLRWERGGLDHHRRGSHHHRGVRIARPVRPPPPIRPPECPEPDPNADPWAFKAVASVPVSPVPVASVPMAFIPVPLVPVPVTVGVPEVRTDKEQPHEHDEYGPPLLPRSHDRRLSLRVQILIFLNIIPPISRELPRQRAIPAGPVQFGPLKRAATPRARMKS